MTSAAEDFLKRAAVDALAQVPAARRPARSRGPCVAIAVRDDIRPTDQPYVDEMMTGVGEVLARGGCRAIMLYGHTDDIYWTLADYIARWGVTGMILVSNHENDPLPDLLASVGFPMVSQGRPTCSAPVPYVDVDNVAGARGAVEHLLARGPRHPAVVAGPADMAVFPD
ncbi:MAG: LacI family transcriptional regulator, partial [Actinomycetota bacterium]|nr:LacI family transcriptional regulator [Actinomycetota bacterium]